MLNFISRQPATLSMPLFSNTEILNKLLEVLSVALHSQSAGVILQAVSTLSSLLRSNHVLDMHIQYSVIAVSDYPSLYMYHACSIHHMPPGFPLSTFLPLLALLLHHIEPLAAPPNCEANTSPQCSLTPTAKKQLTEVLSVMERMCR